MFRGANGIKVFIDPRSLALLDGTVLDFDENNLMATSFVAQPARENWRMWGVPGMSTATKVFEDLAPEQSQNAGFITDVEQDIVPKSSARTPSG